MLESDDRGGYEPYTLRWMVLQLGTCDDPRVALWLRRLAISEVHDTQLAAQAAISITTADLIEVSEEAGLYRAVFAVEATGEGVDEWLAWLEAARAGGAPRRVEGQAH